jgi:hypothetical protein
MIPSIVTVAQAGRQRSGPVRIIPVVPAVTATPAGTVREPMTIPAARPTVPGTYFGLFQQCGCGHSSAWHGGAFGDAWRAGVQVRGACEAADEVDAGSCGCRRFREPDVAV